MGRTFFMPTDASITRQVRRQLLKAMEVWRASPEYQARMRAQQRQQRRQQQREIRQRRFAFMAVGNADSPWPQVFKEWYIKHLGRTLGGKPSRHRRCTKRLGTRQCWNWRTSHSDRCHRHSR
jgi:hypothetical protein